jgi:hypothetical protein
MQDCGHFVLFCILEESQMTQKLVCYSYKTQRKATGILVRSDKLPLANWFAPLAEPFGAPLDPLAAESQNLAVRQ